MAEAFRAAGVMGWPVAHSRSPAVHGYWLRRHAIAGAYLPLPVHPDRVVAALRGLAALGFAGCNVTVPHKETVLLLADHVDPLARRIGAANLIVVRPDFSLEARNTDGFGFLENLREQAPRFRASAGPAVVLGAGGAARAVVTALADAGSPEIRLLNRSHARAEALAAELGGPLTVLDWARRGAALEGAALLVNTTSLGMAGGTPLDLDLGALPGAAVVSDLVYVPLQTPLLAAARARGNAVVEGLGMLLHQARPSFEAWFGVAPEVTAELRTMIAATL
jgi:shikimate dehydrogenase